MASATNSEDWDRDVEVLHELARELYPQPLQVQVRISRRLADLAVAAWQREESDGERHEETSEQATARDEAATLALIGLAIEETGVSSGNDVVFKVDAWLVGNALSAADKAGRLDGPLTSD